MSDLWQILGIEPTIDQKEIKRAYARNLKKARPEEDAAAFQALNEAYKTALFMAEHPAVSLNDPMLLETQEGTSEAVSCDGSKGSVTATIVDMGAAVSDNQNLDDKRQLKIDQFAEQVQALLTNANQLHFPKKWEFLGSHDRVFDQSFMFALGQKVLEILIDHNRRNRTNKRKHRQVSKETLNSLDGLFNWRANIYEYQAFVDLDDIVELLAGVPGGGDHEYFYHLVLEKYHSGQGGLPLELAYGPDPYEDREPSSDWSWVFYILPIAAMALSKIFAAD